MRTSLLVGVFLSALCVASACGSVEGKSDRPCDAYCDHALECSPDADPEACAFACGCIEDSIHLEVAPQYVQCLADADCDAVQPEFACGMLVAGDVPDPSQATLDFIDRCNVRKDELGGCEGMGYDCEIATLLVDRVISEAGSCLEEEETCEDVVLCIDQTFFAQCLGGFTP